MVMAGVEDSSVMHYKSVIRGHHAYKRTQSPRNVRFDALYKLFSL